MAGSLELERKIENLKTIHEIVNSMKALATLTVRKVEELLPTIRMYNEHVHQSMGEVLHHFPYLAEAPGPDAGRTAYVVFTSEQGLCGTFNERLLDYCQGLEDSAKSVFIISGRRGQDEALARGIPVLKALKGPVSADSIELKVMNLTVELFELYRQGTFDRLSVVFALHRRLGEYRIMSSRVLPPDLGRFSRRKAMRREPLMYMSPEDVLERLVEEHLLISLYRAYAESLASENSSRLRSMDSAAQNIERKREDLLTLFNYVRQEEVTAEVLEIISGYESLSGGE
ncbi:MAG: hypothetical protein GXO94_04115 [Nitrospirae bacterium]|nr:hypothetical protein [Nitrospirota bacterium]